jgi:hypothetical protein
VVEEVADLLAVVVQVLGGHNLEQEEGALEQPPTLPP